MRWGLLTSLLHYETIFIDNDRDLIMKKFFCAISSKRMTVILVVLLIFFGLIDIRLYTIPLPKVPEPEEIVDYSIDPPKPGTTDYCIFLSFNKQDIEIMAKVRGMNTDQLMRLYDETIPAHIRAKRIGEPIIRLGKRASVYCINYSLGIEV